jgi:hypothetical protein
MRTCYTKWLTLIPHNSLLISVWVRSKDAHMLHIMVNPNCPQFFIIIIMGEEQGCAHVTHNG